MITQQLFSHSSAASTAPTSPIPPVAPALLARLERIARAAQRLIQMPIIIISLGSGEQQLLTLTEGLAIAMPRGSAFYTLASTATAPFMIGDTTRDARCAGDPLVLGPPQIRCYASHPLRGLTGTVIGSFGVLDTTPRTLPSDDLATLADLATWAERELHTLPFAHDAARRPASAVASQHEDAVQAWAILDHLGDGLITFDETGRILSINPRAAELFRTTVEAIIGQSIWTLLPPTYPGEPILGLVREPVQSRDDRRSGLERNVGFRRERRGHTCDGRTFPAELTVSTVVTQSGLHYIASIRDLTTRTQAIEALARQTTTLREQEQLLELAHDAIIACDVDQIVRFWSQGATALYGWHEQEARGQGLHSLLQTRFPLPQRDLVAELFRTGRWGGELEQIRRDGTGVIVASRWALQRDDHGQPRGILILNNDITARKRAELKVRVTLSELEHQYREADRARAESHAVFNATSEAMVLIAPDRRIVTINQQFSQFFAIRPAEVKGQLFSTFATQVERVFANATAFAARMSGTADDTEHQFTDIVEQRWPERRELHLFSTPVWSEEGEHLGRLYLFRDITHEREVDRMKSQFISLVSHELRTPLTSIKGFIDLLLLGEAGALNEEQLEFLSIAGSNATRLAALINDLLDLSRIEAGRLELRRETLNLGTLIQAVALSMRPLLAGKDQHLTITLPPTVPLILGDADRITQILTNLLSNAHKYTPHDGAISVSVTTTVTLAQIVVSDTGVGLTPEDQAQVFTAFFRAQNQATQHIGGTGLGLAITRSLVELHGGVISVESTPGVGATFRFTLPLAAPHTG